jgi:glycerol-3-phosphate dehydrogenase (NAD(P)+)
MMVEAMVQAQRWGVLGAGAWGTALAQVLAQQGHEVLVWDRDPSVVMDINTHHRNRKRHPEVLLDARLRATDHVADVLAACDLLLVALPSDVNVALAPSLAKLVRPQQGVVLAGKGFRDADGAVLTQVWQDAGVAPAQLAVLSGPSFAQEMIGGALTGVLVASHNADLRSRVLAAWEGSRCRAFGSEDVMGAQVGGALKNVLAVASGLLAGLDVGHNTRALVLTRGLAEMGQYAVALGGTASTVFGLAGLGDVILTATSALSRNYRFGELVGKGVPVTDAKLRLGTVEGMAAARIVTVQAQARGLDLALFSTVDAVLQGDVSPLEAFDHLWVRPQALEITA